MKITFSWKLEIVRTARGVITDATSELPQFEHRDTHTESQLSEPQRIGFTPDPLPGIEPLDPDSPET